MVRTWPFRQGNFRRKGNAQKKETVRGTGGVCRGAPKKRLTGSGRKERRLAGRDRWNRRRKTTVLQLMMGYFQPSRGEIRIRGIPVRNMEPARVRSAILPGGLCSIIGKFVELSYDRTKQAFRLLYNRRNTCSAVSARFWRACSGFMASSRVQMLLRIGK